MKANNLYEDAYVGLGWFGYHRAWGDASQQIAALRRAIAHEDDARYLAKDLFVQALQGLFRLEVETSDYAAALLTGRRLVQQGLAPELETEIGGVMAEIEQLRGDGRSYGVDGVMGSGTSWFYRLLKNRFRIVVEEGRLAEIKLRCEKQYLLFRYDPALEYRIADRYGFCDMELVGDPNTRFRLIQS